MNAYDSYRERVAQLHGSLSRLGVSYLFLKTIKAFPYSDANVDVLLPHAGDFKRVKDHFRSQGFREAFTFEFDKAMLLPPSGGPAIHLYREISWYTVPYLAGAEVLERARVVSWEGLKLPVPSAEDDYIIHALHAIFEQEALTWGDCRQLRHLKGELNPKRLPKLMASPTVRWAAARVEEALEEMGMIKPPAPGREHTVVYTFPERTLLEGFKIKLGEELRLGRYAVMLKGLYAYGLIHVLKRLRLIRG